MNRRVLLIYTGGTIGMYKKQDGSFGPFDFDKLLEYIPEINKLEVDISCYAFEEPIDSSNMDVTYWQEIATLLYQKRDGYDGFVILHGSDTMAYTACAVSFMLAHFNKPIIFTGSQLPIGILRTDAKENLLTAIEIASSYNARGVPIVPELALYFEYHLYRGNRTVKTNAELFNSFQSPNYPSLAEAGVHINYNHVAIADLTQGAPALVTNFCTDVAILKLFPGMNAHYVQSVLAQPNLKGVVIESFGTGNAPTAKWFLEALDHAIQRNVLVVNATQCISGSVDQGRYETSVALAEMGVISAGDMTTEAAITKMMFVLGNVSDRAEQINVYRNNIRGEKKEIIL